MHQLEVVITRQTIARSLYADPAQVAPVVAGILGEGWKRRADVTTTIRSSYLLTRHLKQYECIEDEQYLLCFRIRKRAKPTGMQGMNQNRHHVCCFGLSSTFRRQNKLAFRVWLGCYILHANTARNLVAEPRDWSSEFQVHTTAHSSRVLCSATAIELGVIRSASLPPRLHRHGLIKCVLVCVESRIKLISCFALRSSRLQTSQAPSR